MKDIKGHKSRDQGEIIEILIRSGTYTCPTLPHYRYERVQAVCRNLQRRGLLQVSGRNPESINLTVTPLFRQWQAAHTAGETPLGVVEWVKRGVPGQMEEVA
jgi:hypothetical protein